MLLTAAGAALLWIARDVLLLGFLAVLIAVVFSFPVNALARVIGRGASVVVVLLLVVGSIAGFAVVAVPALADEGRQVVETIPDALERARTLLRREARKTGGAVATPEKVTKTVQEQAESAGKAALSQVIPVALTTAEVLVTAVLVLVLAAFLVHAPEDYQRALRTLVPREHEPTFDELWSRLGLALRHWVGGILVSMLLMGGLTAIALALAGIRGWPLLALLTFFGTFVPYLGAIASAVPGLLVGLSMSSAKLLAAAGIYLGVHLVEGYLVQPLVMKHAVQVRPATLLLGQAAAAAVFGVLGAIVATPLLVCVKVVVGQLYIEGRLGKAGPRA